MSLWLDPVNFSDWHWSVQIDMRIVESGVETNYTMASVKVANAMDIVVRMNLSSIAALKKD
jgi:hypothetical protein